jgi:hypothetical protein
MLEKMESGDYDLVTGWRINRREPGLRRLLSTTANRLISRSTGIFIHDRGCSLKLYRSELVKHMRLYGQQHRFLPEPPTQWARGGRDTHPGPAAQMEAQNRLDLSSATGAPGFDYGLFPAELLNSPMRFGTIALVSTLYRNIHWRVAVVAKIYHGIIEGWPGYAYQIGSRPIFLLAILLILVVCSS